MESQKQRVLSRIEERKKMAKSVPKFYFRESKTMKPAIFEGDKSAGQNLGEKELQSKILREKLNEMIEENNREKEKILEDTKRKYKSQISTLQSQIKNSTGILQKVLDKLKMEESSALLRIEKEYADRLESKKAALIQ